MKERLRPIMFVGTGSDVGKSLVSAGFCRLFLQEGYQPAPFKAQNMSLNSYATPEGLELGRAQAMQAEASGIPCRVEMNPILLKPNSNQVSQVILNGKPIGNKSARAYFEETDRDELFREVMKAYDRLAAEYSPMVIEGAGSISEMNLWDKDIVNMRVARATDAATILVADIDRGGIFASVYGSLALLPEEERKQIVGVIINKFRGDISLFDEGRKMLEELTGVPVVGILPYMKDLYIEEEDSVSLERRSQRAVSGKINVAVVLLRHLSNFTDFDMLEHIEGVNLYFTDQPGQLREADIIILPGSKNTLSDMELLREKGLEEVILSHHKAEKPLYGICGGYQMMGQEIADPMGVEGEVRTIRGLGVLPTRTTLTGEKETRQRSFRFLQSEATGIGYEIHMGRTESDSPLCELEDGSTDGYYLNSRCWGSYIHGILDNASVITAVLREINPQFSSTIDHKALKEAAYDTLAETIRQSVDMDYIYKCLKR